MAIVSNRADRRRLKRAALELAADHFGVSTAELQDIVSEQPPWLEDLVIWLGERLDIPQTLSEALIEKAVSLWWEGRKQ